MGHMWVNRSLDFSINQGLFKASYKLIDPGKEAEGGTTDPAGAYLLRTNPSRRTGRWGMNTEDLSIMDTSDGTLFGPYPLGTDPTKRFWDYADGQANLVKTGALVYRLSGPVDMEDLASPDEDPDDPLLQIQLADPDTGAYAVRYRAFVASLDSLDLGFTLLDYPLLSVPYADEGIANGNVTTGLLFAGGWVFANVTYGAMSGTYYSVDEVDVGIQGTYVYGRLIGDFTNPWALLGFIPIWPAGSIVDGGVTKYNWLFNDLAYTFITATGRIIVNSIGWSSPDYGTDTSVIFFSDDSGVTWETSISGLGNSISYNGYMVAEDGTGVYARWWSGASNNTAYIGSTVNGIAWSEHESKYGTGEWCYSFGTVPSANRRGDVLWPGNPIGGSPFTFGGQAYIQGGLALGTVGFNDFAAISPDITSTLGHPIVIGAAVYNHPADQWICFGTAESFSEQYIVVLARDGTLVSVYPLFVDSAVIVPFGTFYSALTGLFTLPNEGYDDHAWAYR